MSLIEEELVIEWLCVWLPHLFMGSSLVGKNCHVKISPEARRTCCSYAVGTSASVSQDHHDGELSLLIVVRSQLFVDCSLL